MYINVLIEIANINVDKTFTYHVPKHLESRINIGVRVEIPFQNRTLEGFIVEVLDKHDFDYEIKDIIEVIDDEVILTSELLELGKYLKNITLSSLVSCYQVMLPKALKVKHGVKINKKYKSYLRLLDNNYKPDNIKQKEIIDLLEKDKIIEKSILHNISPSSVKTLLKNRVIEEIKEEEYRLTNKNKNKVDYQLTSDQKTAVKNIEETNKIVSLLHGVTGSGKTVVYMSLIENIIKKGQAAIVLVPEISLTEQIISRFTEKFENIAVLHSRLSDGERYDEYRKIVRNEVDIVIGARSAVFAPLKNLGLIIIDEEHTASFKQDNDPKYRALDIAIKRMEMNNGKVVLGSATPSIETYIRAIKGIYNLVELKNRANNQNLPNIEIVDMNDEVKKGNQIISNYLIDKMRIELEQNNQIMLLLNRRGYSQFISCKNCGYAVKCPNCDITLTYHKTSNNLRCHYCGYATKLYDICPECHEKSLTNLGLGTEKVEEKIKELFPNNKIMRMDLDTTTKKGAHEKIINAFQNHEADILLGTQMIAKGLDFKNVTLVGIINADTSLNISDYKASENTFQLLCQASGRSGRGDKKGEVVIQTYNKDHYAINYAKNHDYLGFFKEELNIRKKLSYPPYYYLISIKIISKDYDKLKIESSKIGIFLKQKLTESQILGPTVANIFKVNNTYRFQIVIKYKKQPNLLEILKQLQNHYKNTNIKVDIDFNPNNI